MYRKQNRLDPSCREESGTGRAPPSKYETLSRASGAAVIMRWYTNFGDAENGSLAPCLEGEKLYHSEKISIFQSQRYFDHDVPTGNEASY